MPAIDKLLSFLTMDNVADELDDETQSDIVKQVVKHYRVDDESRANWLEMNKEALKIIKCAENGNADPDKEFPFYKASKIIYPLIGPAVIQLASRLITHLTQNGKVAYCSVLGPDPDGQKKQRAERVSDFMSYEFLVESDTWLTDEHKLCTILAAWGIAFKEVYYDKVTSKNDSEIISPEDVIINHNTTSLDKARRITVRIYLTKNDIIEKQRSGCFSEFDLDNLLVSYPDNQDMDNDGEDEQPVFEILKQYCYLDLDDDEYEEPYCVYVHAPSQTLLGVYPAFDPKDISINDKSGKIKSIKSRFNIVDYHLIDDPEGKFYSLGLNHLLLHQNKAITVVLRELLDSGLLANTQGGFITKAFKTKQRSIRFKMGQFEVLDCGPNVDPSKQILPLPFKEPSNVLFQLLGLLISTGEKQGFMTDVLSGDTQMQNVPATTMLAMVEQGTRVFKPVVQKLYQALKKEFKIWFHLHNLYMDQDKYFRFEDQEISVAQNDFDEKSLDIVPVADPTQSSEGHKYAKLQAMIQVWGTQAIQFCNVPEQLKELYTALQFDNPENMVNVPQPGPDHQMIELQLKDKIATQKHEIDSLKQIIAGKKVDLEEKKVEIKQQDTNIKAAVANAEIHHKDSDLVSNMNDTMIKHRVADIQEYKAVTERSHNIMKHKIDSQKKPNTGV